jgi:hypothetical protein
MKSKADFNRGKRLGYRKATWDAIFAVRHLAAHYPESMFPLSSDTPEARAANFARRLCHELETTLDEFLQDGPA